MYDYNPSIIVVDRKARPMTTKQVTSRKESQRKSKVKFILVKRPVTQNFPRRRVERKKNPSVQLPQSFPKRQVIKIKRKPQGGKTHAETSQETPNDDSFKYILVN